MSTLAPALIVLPILGLALPLARRSGRGMGTAIFQAVSCLLLAELACGLVGALRPGSLVLWAGGTLWLASELALRPRAALALLREPAPLVLAALAVAHAWGFADARYAYFDEFDQWGLASREMRFNDALYGLTSNVARPSAPPAAAVWHYLVCRHTSFSEGATFTANFLLFLAPLLPLYDGPSRLRPVWSVLATAALVLVTALFTAGGASVMVDHLLGSFTAGLLLVWLQAPDRRDTPLWLIAPACVLPLLKESGLFLALCALGFLPLHRLVAYALGQREAPLLGRLVRPSLLLAVPLIAVGTWQARVAILEGPEPQTEMWSVATSLFGDGSEDVVNRDELRRRFAHVFASQTLARSAINEQINEFSYPHMERYPRGLSTAGWLLLTLALLAGTFALVRDPRARSAAGALMAFWPGVLGVYLLVLFDVYATDFGAAGIVLPGYVRYVDSVVFPMVLVSLAQTFPALARDAQGMRRPLAVAAVLVGLAVLGNPYFSPLYRAREQYPFARQIEPWTRRVLEATGGRGDLFVHYPAPTEYMHVIVLRYLLTPLRVGVQFMDLSRVEPGSLLPWISAYDFAWFLRTGPALEEELAPIAPEPVVARALYRVTRRDGVATLEVLRSRREIQWGERAERPGPGEPPDGS